MNVWATLGIAATTDRAVIRRAYAKALRVTNPEDDAEGFKQLRAAYELALAYADNAAAWDDADRDAPEAAVQVVLSEAALAELIEDPEPVPLATPAAPRFRSEAMNDAAPELADLRADRDAEITRLNDLLGTLAQALHGPWNADEASLREMLAAILAQPVLGEIALYADVEQVIAGMLAATIPRSDAILFEAARAFGWAAARPGAVSPAVAAVLARLDEWRLIETFKRAGHPLRRAWRSLTRPPGPYWWWRIAALRPGVEAGVATLLGIDGPVAPGLAYAFQAASVARWRALLDRPHWTRSMAAAIPLTALLSTFLSDAVGLPWAGDGPVARWGRLAVILLSPVAPFAARVARARFLRRDHPVWLTQGWIGALATVLLGAMLLPASPLALLVLTVASAMAWAWMAIAAGQASRAERIARLRTSWLPILLCALFGGAAATLLHPVHRAALALMLALGATLMAAPLAPIADLLARWPHWRAGFAVPLVLAIAGMAYGCACFSVAGEDTRLFYAATLTLIAGSVVVAAAQIGGVRSNREYLALRLLRVGLIGAFLFTTIISIGDQPSDTSSPPPVTLPMT